MHNHLIACYRICFFRKSYQTYGTLSVNIVGIDVKVVLTVPTKLISFWRIETHAGAFIIYIRACLNKEERKLEE
jgi:hypothetical protein